MCVYVYGAYFWIINNRNQKNLESFHDRTARNMTEQHIQKHEDGSCTYLNHEEFEKKCDFFSIRTNIQRRRGTMKKYMES